LKQNDWDSGPPCPSSILSRREWLAGLGALAMPGMVVGQLSSPAKRWNRGAGAPTLPVQVDSPIQFARRALPFTLENDESRGLHVPATMAGGVAVFDYNRDGRPDLFFANGANLATLTKDSPKFSNCLLRNDGNGVFTDVTEKAGLAGVGFANGVAVGDYDNDGYPDLFVTGVHRNTLYHNNGDGTFTDVTAKAGLNRFIDPQFGPLWSVAAAWVDINNDGLLDLFVVNYLQWSYAGEPVCNFGDKPDYCAPQAYKGLPCQLFLNKGDGTFEDVSASWGLRSLVGKGMGVGVADYDGDGRPDLFVTNDKYYNFLLHNSGSGFKDMALEAGVGLVQSGEFVSGMGLDFRDIDNDGRPDIVFTALNNETFPVFLNRGKSGFEEVTYQSGMEALSRPMAGYGAGLFDFDNDGWKDLFVTRGHVLSLDKPGTEVNQHNTVFRNLGASGKWQALTEQAGLASGPAARHRGCAFGDLDGDGRIDVVTTALGQPAELWMNRTTNAGHWLGVQLRGTRSNRDGVGAVVKLVTRAGTQYNHMTTSVGYASSSHGPVHFGLGEESRAQAVEVRWPSGRVQTLRNITADQIITVREPQR